MPEKISTPTYDQAGSNFAHPAEGHDTVGSDGDVVVVVVDVAVVAVAAVEAVAHVPPGESPVASGAADTSPPVASAGVADTFPPVAVGGPASRCVAAAVGFGVVVAADPDAVGANGVDACDIALLAQYWYCYC